MPLGGSYYIHFTDKETTSHCHPNSAVEKTGKRNRGAAIWTQGFWYLIQAAVHLAWAASFLPVSEGSGEWLPT